MSWIRSDFSNVHMLIYDKAYIRDIQFNPNNWPAPGRVNEEAIEADDVQVHPRNRLKRTRLAGAALQGKTIADVFEALIGNRT